MGMAYKGRLIGFRHSLLSNDTPKTFLLKGESNVSKQREQYFVPAKGMLWGGEDYFLSISLLCSEFMTMRLASSSLAVSSSRMYIIVVLVLVCPMA